MTDLTSLGYPEGYHLGFSFILWIIFMVVVAALGIKLYLNARKSDLINVKEMFRAKGFLYIGISINFSLIQIGVFFSHFFFQFYFLGALILCFSSTFYFYYWEKNLTSIKRIPTISIGVSSIIALIALITSFIFLELLKFLMDFFLFTVLSLFTLALVLYFYLVYVFTKNVKGISTIVSKIWMVGVILIIISPSFDIPPGVKIFPPFIVLYIAPILYMIGLIMSFYGVNKMFAQISSFYAQTQKCAVHRGKIEKGKTVYYCPSCGIVYCETCFNQVIKKDGCWNCRKGAEVEIEEEWKADIVVELEKADKHKSKN